MKISLILSLKHSETKGTMEAVTSVTPEYSDVNNINYRLSIGVASLMSQLMGSMREEDNDNTFLLLKRLQGETASKEGLPVNDGFWHCLSITHPFDYGVKLYYKVEE